MLDCLESMCTVYSQLFLYTAQLFPTVLTYCGTYSQLVYTSELFSTVLIYCWTYSQLFFYTAIHILNCSYILLNIFPTVLIYCWTYFQLFKTISGPSVAARAGYYSNNNYYRIILQYYNTVFCVLQSPPYLGRRDKISCNCN